MTDTSSTISVAELRAGLPDAISRATFGHERIAITRRGKVAAVLIGPAALARPEWLDDNEDLAALRHARKEDDGERISLDEARRKWHHPLNRYTLSFTRTALKELNKLEQPLRRRILAAITLLEENPRPDGVKKLAGDENAWRIRIGDHRLLYEIHDGNLLVVIFRAAHRREVLLDSKLIDTCPNFVTPLGDMAFWRMRIYL